jgi:4-hydroxy-tetrahydrodipicolinate synthase
VSAPTDRSRPLDGGVWGILPTPFHPDGSLDLSSIDQLVRFFRDQEVTGLVALGVFGEAAQLSMDEQRTVLARVAAAADGVPLVAGIAALETSAAAEQARTLAAAVPTLRAVMTKVPSADAAVTAEHLTRVSEAAGVGIVVQDYPVESGVTIASEDLLDAVVRCGVAVAVKAEATPTTVGIARLAPHLDVPVFGGLGGVGLLDELACGSAGAMTGFSHPEALWAAVRAFQEDGFVAAREAYAPWLPLANFEGQLRIGLALRKEILKRRGALACAQVRPPAASLPPELVGVLEQHLATVPTASEV